MTLSHDPHIEDLLGAYALDAVGSAERMQVEQHLLDCPRCTREVEEHREVAALLSSSDDSVPATIWAAIEDEMAPPDNVIPLRPRSRGSLPPWLAVVAAIAVFSLVGAVFLQSSRVEQLGQQVAAEQAQIEELMDLIATDPLTAAVEDALADPESVILTLAATDVAGAGDVRVVLTPAGNGFVLDNALPALPDSQTYQLWAVTDGRIVSAGLLGPDVTNGAFRVDLDDLTALAITPEVAGGVVVSDAAPVAVVALDS